MNLFHVIDDAFVILRSKGVFRQAKAFRRGDELYASFGTGFVRIMAEGGTSVPALSWIALSGNLKTGRDKHGRLVLETV